MKECGMRKTSITVGVIGATGHTGEELVDILLRHPQVSIGPLCNTSEEPQRFTDCFPRFKGRIDRMCTRPDLKEIARSCDAVFLALPHTTSMTYAADLLALNKRIIDLSADYRLSDARTYAAYYGTAHKDTPNLKKAVYGLPELYRAQIRDASLVANPGCYPTCVVLGLAPLFALGIGERDSVVVDAKSGVTGAGRKMLQGFLFSEVNEDFRAYKVDTHQHAPEINQILSRLSSHPVAVTFVPHLLPLNRGILATMYVRTGKRSKEESKKVIAVYKKFYKAEPFIRIKEEGEFPRLKDVVHTNFCDIGIRVNRDYIIVIAALDNLVKGAAGQAVQNMNIMYGLAQETGLL